MEELGLTDLTRHFIQHIEGHMKLSVGWLNSESPVGSLQKACKQLSHEFPDLFKPELGCLKGFEMEVNFKPEARSMFCKPRPIPMAILEDFNNTYKEGIRRGVWQHTDFNTYRTRLVPVWKVLRSGQGKLRIRVCGDYSVTVNPQLDTHRQPIPLPEDLTRNLRGGYCLTKIDLANAYNQIKLAPERQKRLALSTHQGVLLQMRLPFGTKSMHGYFQEIMEQLIEDLCGVAFYMDDLLVSVNNEQMYFESLRALFEWLNGKGLRCNLEKCIFTQPIVEYLGRTLSKDGVAKGSKVDAVLKMPPPKDVETLRSFLGSVQL